LVRETFMTNPLDESGGVDSLDVETIAESVIETFIEDEVINVEKKEKIPKKKISGLDARRKLEDNLDARRIREALNYIYDPT
jgi:hypothetical protein